jgi:hypothetical protein
MLYKIIQFVINKFNNSVPIKNTEYERTKEENEYYRRIISGETDSVRSNGEVPMYMYLRGIILEERMKENKNIKSFDDNDNVIDAKDRFRGNKC